ncbi:MAG: hydroxyacid dehydrogenase [Ruminococcaceae bacterium]|nr:hydroxyacid dehydrogenase [Oscillospiraceae bacterium]
MRIYVTMPCNPQTDTFLTPKALKTLNSLGEVFVNPENRQLTNEEVVEWAHDADVLITCWGTCKYTKADVEKMPNLKLIAHTGGTLLPVVDQDVFETNVQAISGNDVFAKSVAEGALCYTLDALRRIEFYSNEVREGRWRAAEFQNRGLIGKTVGIVGFGTIAKFFVELIRWFDCDVLIYSSHLSNEDAAKYGARTASLQEIFSTCDVISIHASNNPKTRGLVTRELLESMKQDALIVNTARGPIVDEEALFELLMKGRICGALDVFCEEPLAVDNPIRQCKNVLLLPHMGGPTIDMRENVTLEICKEIKRLKNGEPLVHPFTAEAVKRMTPG